MSDIYAVRIKEHTGNEISAPHWPVGKFLRFRPAPEDTFGPSFDGYEAVDVERASFCTKREALAIVRFCAKYLIVCEIRRFVEAADVVA